jgi:phage major head subunit gpT-like protein
MGAITPEFLHDLESRMQTIMETQYGELLSDQWWQRVAKTRTSTSKRERLIWLLETAKIIRLEAGSMQFEDLVATVAEFENLFAGAGMKLTKEQLEDVFNGMPGGEGLELAGAWSRQIGVQAAYWPQNQVAEAIKAGEDSASLTYDGKPFFALDHHVNGVDAGDGSFANLLNATSLGTLAPIHGPESGAGSVTADVAMQNLQRVFAYMAGVKMPNGRDPRKLRPVGIIVPPSMSARAQQLTNARLLAQAASGGAGGADVEAIIRNWGIGQPIQADELGANLGGDDRDYYVIAAGADRSELGALVYMTREAFNVVFHGPMTDAQLARMREFQWLTGGRNVVGYGHPYLLFKVKGS